MFPIYLLAILYVSPDGSGQYPTIQSAVDAALDGDEVHLSGLGGAYEGAGNWEVDLQGKAIKIKPAGDKGFPQFFCYDAPHTIFHIDQGEGRTTVLEGLYFGTILTAQGTIKIQGSSPTIRNCFFYGSETGPAIYCKDGDPYIVNCTLSENDSPYILIDDGVTCVGLWDCALDERDEIGTLNGGCYRIIHNGMEEPPGRPLAEKSASWGRILSAYR